MASMPFPDPSQALPLTTPATPVIHHRHLLVQKWRKDQNPYVSPAARIAENSNSRFKKRKTKVGKYLQIVSLSGLSLEAIERI
jgi:hypothetical protein